jgi:hypothetical protein
LPAAVVLWATAQTTEGGEESGLKYFVDFDDEAR